MHVGKLTHTHMRLILIDRNMGLGNIIPGVEFCEDFLHKPTHYQISSKLGYGGPGECATHCREFCEDWTHPHTPSVTVDWALKINYTYTQLWE